jgi:hypothetical protein
MSKSKNNIKATIRSYILKMGALLKEELDDKRFEFGFRFLYPNEKGRLFMATKPKKKEHIEISIGTPLAPEHKKAFNTLEVPDRKTFIKNLQKLLYEFELEYSYNFSQHYTIVLIDKLFIEQDYISMNQFYQTTRALFNYTMKLVLYIRDFFSDEFDISDIIIK